MTRPSKPRRTSSSAAAVFELRNPGRFRVNVHIEGPGDQARVGFEMDVESNRSPRVGIWPWILWPVPVILLYMVHRRLVAGRGKREYEKLPGLTHR